MKFVKIGHMRVNLDTVIYIQEDSHYPGDIKVHFACAVGGFDGGVGGLDTAWYRFSGDEAKLLLAYVDDDMLAADALKKRINAAKSVEASPVEEMPF